jgi:hypothetical protein
MKRFIRTALAVPLACMVFAAAPASAQNIYPYQSPRYGPGWQTPLSPYLNLLIPGNVAVNYYGLVEPQFQARQFQNVTTQTLQGMLNQFPLPPGALLEEDFNAPMRATGHPTAVNYTGSYFGTLTGQPFVSEGAYGQNRVGGGMGATGLGGGRGGAMGMGGGSGTGPNMRPGMGGGGAGTWPNLRTGVGPGR